MCNTLNALTNSIKSHFCCCLWCNSILIHQHSGYCLHCYKVLWERHSSTSYRTEDFNQKPIMVYSLFKWEKDVSPMVSILIMQMKKGAFPKTTQHYAEKLIGKRIELNSNAVGSTTLVPAPSKKTGVAQDHCSNHAFLIAKYVSEVLKIPLVTPLKAKNQKSQHTLNREQRALLSFECDEQFTKLRRPDHKIIFIDDILTTGATARAAYIALGCPQNFEVWVLAERTLGGSQS